MIFCLWLLALCAFCLSCVGNAAAVKGSAVSDQSLPGDPKLLFDDGLLHRVDLKMESAVYEQILAEHHPYGATPPYRLVAEFRFDGLAMGKVALRGRGNSFNSVNRRSFKLKFDCVDPLTDGHDPDSAGKGNFPEYENRKFLGLSSLNLRCSNNDPSLVRELLSYKLFRQAKVPAPRASLALLSINGKPLGVYSLVEDVNKGLIKEWFKDSSGALYKCAWSGNGGASFEAASYSSGRYEKQSGPKGDSEISAFIEALAKVSSAQELDALVDKDNVLRYNALCALTGHWDSLNGNINNDYVYRNPKDGKWRVIVWDTDNSLGSDWIPQIDSRFAPIDIVAANPGSSALFCRLAARYWKDDYRRILGEILEKQGDGSAFSAEAYRLRDQIKDALRGKDPLLQSYPDFLASFDSKPETPPFRGAEIPQYRDGVGLTSYFKARLSDMRDKLEDY